MLEVLTCLIHLKVRLRTGSCSPFDMGILHKGHLRLEEIDIRILTCSRFVERVLLATVTYCSFLESFGGKNAFGDHTDRRMTD